MPPARISPFLGIARFHMTDTDICPDCDGCGYARERLVCSRCHGTGEVAEPVDDWEPPETDPECDYQGVPYTHLP